MLRPSKTERKCFILKPGLPYARHTLKGGLSSEHTTAIVTHVELARWSLSLHGPYKEIKVPLGPHSFIVPFYRILFGLGITSGTSLPGLTPEAKDVW